MHCVAIYFETELHPTGKNSTKLFWTFELFWQGMRFTVLDFSRVWRSSNTSYEWLMSEDLSKVYGSMTVLLTTNNTTTPTLKFSIIQRLR